MGIDIDVEREYLMDEVFAIERAGLIEQEYYEFREPAKVTAKITFKTTTKDENRINTPPLSRTSEKIVQSGHDLPIKSS
jgi:hypothetical protein